MTPREKLQARHLDQRFRKAIPKAPTKRIVVFTEYDGRMRLLLGTSCASRTNGGRMYRLRLRLYLRFCTRLVTQF